MTDLLLTLRSLGKDSAAKIYRRHGALGEVLGVSYADLGKLKKKHDGDHPLAEQLWKSGVHEARVLATQIADGEKVSRAELEGWQPAVTGDPLSVAFAELVARTPHADALMTKWMKSSQEWTQSIGWQLLAAKAKGEAFVDEKFFEPFLKQISDGIHEAPNRVRHTMNGALIHIGARGGGLETKALKVAKAIGKVEVDHGHTSCETPDAALYIAKLKARKAKRAS